MSIFIICGFIIAGVSYLIFGAGPVELDEQLDDYMTADPDMDGEEG